MSIDYEKVLRENLSEGAFPIITSNEKEFADWIRRVRWQSKRCDEMYYELKGYKDAEEQGLLLRLPCKVGDTVFIPMKPHILEYNITDFVISRYGAWLMHLEHEEGGRKFRTVELGESIGKTWFLTREKAEAALAEKGGA